MASIVTSKFRVYNADQFVEALSEAAPSYLYMFIGRTRAWADDNTPPTPVDATANTEFEHWRDMMHMKRVQAADVSKASVRYDWTTGTVYTQYSDSVDLNTEDFFVMTDEYKVYKCLFNNSGAASTTKPTHVSTTVAVDPGDGYLWKYMLTMVASDAVKFLTSGYVPISTLSSDDGSTQWDVQAASVNGAIDVIGITAAGSQNDKVHNGTFQSVANTTQMVIAAAASSTDNYYNGSTLVVTGGTGVGGHKAIATYAGSSKTVVLSSNLAVAPTATSTYDIVPTITITGDGSGATAYADVVAAGNTVSAITVSNRGTGYTRATVAFTGNGVSGVTGQAYVGPPGGHGSDPAQELMSYNVVLNTKFDKSESDVFTTDNNFRVIGLLRDPLIANGSAATATTYDHTVNLTITGISGSFSADEVVTGGTSTANGYVVEANTTVVKLTQTDGTFSVAETITGTGGATGTVSIANTGLLLNNSGDIMYVEHRSPIARASDQIEDVKLIIRF